MNEGNLHSMSADAWMFVDESSTSSLVFRKCFLYIVHSQRDVMQSATSLLKKSSQRAVGRRGFKQLDSAVTYGQKCDADLLFGHFFRTYNLQTEDITVETNPFVNTLHCNSYMVNLFDSHVSYLTICQVPYTHQRLLARYHKSRQSLHTLLPQSE